jgi:Xaa-Pro aminopeptidase
MPEEIRERQRGAMRRLGLDGMAIIAPENVCWTTGTMIPSQKAVRHRHAVVLVPAEGEPEMIVVNIEEGFARANADVGRITAYNEFTESPMQMLAVAARRLGMRALGIEAEYLNHLDYGRLEQALAGAGHLVPIDETIRDLRMVKTAAEIERLRRAARIAEAAAHEGLRAWWPGMTELDLSRRIADAFAAHGGDTLSMLSVTSGERTSMLNAPAGLREIARGDVVRIDVIGSTDHYVCDVARTAVAAEPSSEHTVVWQKLVDCRNAALEMIRPGASAQQIFRAYIEKMDAWGLPTLNFLGHGLGLTLHEEPYLNRYKDTTLEAGMVLAVEPLVTFPNLGMQLEDTVVVTAEGCAVTTDEFDTRELWRMAPETRP